MIKQGTLFNLEKQRNILSVKDIGKNCPSILYCPYGYGGVLYFSLNFNRNIKYGEEDERN